MTKNKRSYLSVVFYYNDKNNQIKEPIAMIRVLIGKENIKKIL